MRRAGAVPRRLGPDPRPDELAEGVETAARVLAAVVVAWVGKTNPNTVMVAALFAYLIKVFVLALILMTMPIDGPVNVRWMAAATCVIPAS